MKNREAGSGAASASVKRVPPELEALAALDCPVVNREVSELRRALDELRARLAPGASGAQEVARRMRDARLWGELTTYITETVVIAEGIVEYWLHGDAEEGRSRRTETGAPGMAVVRTQAR